MKIKSRRIIALLLLFVSITGLVVSFGEDVLCAGQPPGTNATANASLGHDIAQGPDGSCPCVPSPSHLPDDHFCTGDCGCPCQAPLSSAKIVANYSPLIAFLCHADITRYIPEVYLSLFVPPDSTAV